MSQNGFFDKTALKKYVEKSLVIRQPSAEGLKGMLKKGFIDGKWAISSIYVISMSNFVNDALDWLLKIWVMVGI